MSPDQQLMETISGNLYDFPRYYDLVFGSDWKAEVDFLQAGFQKHASGRVQRLFEPACGTGRLMFRLSRAGFQVSGLDLNPASVRYCNDRLQRHGFSPTATVGDMTDFRLPHKADAAFNMINSFRHLQTETQARDHLRCVARSLRRGGLYILGLHLTPTTCAPTEEEAWSARRGNLAVNTRLWTTGRDLARREERFVMTYDVYTPSRSIRIEDTIVFRTYTARQFQNLIGRIDELECVETYDFSYDIQRPVAVSGDTEDVVYVLRKV